MSCLEYGFEVYCRDEREQRISDVEYLSQTVRAKAEECLAAVDDGKVCTPDTV